MGFFSFVLSAFKFRRKQTTQEKLQHIDEELETLQESNRRNQQRQKSSFLYLIIISTIIYVSSMFIFYLWYLPVRWGQRLLYLALFLLFPFLIFLLSKVLTKVFVNRISINANAVKELKRNKKKILENVMDTETYKVAKELLQKYDPHRSLVEQSESPLKQSPPKTSTSEGQELRRRNVQTATPDGANKHVRPPVPHASTNGYPVTPVMGPRAPTANGVPVRSPGVPMIRGPAPRTPVPIAPILPRERSVFDKVCDFVIGDGPSNRFALICKQCYGHNGMVLVEEFKFTSYRCCYCGFFNPAKKKRLSAPKLQTRPRSTASDSPNSTDAESSSKADDVFCTPKRNDNVERDKARAIEGDVKDKVVEEDVTENQNTEDTKSTGDSDTVVEEKPNDVETNGRNESLEETCSETEGTNEET